jgi:TorA maturation chaperone TorD
MGYGTDRGERAAAYRVLGQFFLSPPDDEALEAIRQDFSLGSRESLDKIAGEFNDLFSYPRGRLVPLESVFAPSSGGMTGDVVTIYAGADLVIDDAYDVAPDHISVEFLFMSYLIENGKTEMEQKFLEQHLMNWVPYYCGEIIKQAKTLFYREIAEIVKDFLISEYDLYER